MAGDALAAGRSLRLSTWQVRLRGVARAAPFIVACLVYAVALRVGEPVVTGDQPHYALEAHSIAYDFDRDLTDDYLDEALVQRVSGGTSLDAHAYRYTPGGELVSFHAVGLPLLLAPAARLGGRANTMLQLEMVLIAGLAAQILFSILRRLAPGRPRLRWAVWASVVFSLPLLTYATQLYQEMPAALLVLLAVRLLLSERLSAAALVGAGVAIGALPWLHVRFAPIAVGLALLVAARLVARRRPEGGWVVARGLVALALPLALSLGAMAVANQHWYGSPLPTAMAATPAPPVVAPAGVTGAGDAPFSLDRAFSAGDVYAGLARSLFSAGSGWLPFAPVGLLGIAFLLALCVRRRPWALAGLTVALAYLMGIAAAGTPPGASTPGRFEVVLVPLVAIPLLLGLARVRRARWAWAPLAGATAVLAVAGVVRMQDLQPAADQADRPDIGLASALLAPWPAVVDHDGPHLPAMRRMPARPSSRPGVVSATRPVRLEDGDYRIGVPLARRGAAAPGAAAEIVLAGPAGPVDRERVPVSALSAQPRGFEYPVTVAGRAPLRVLVRAPRAAGVTVGAAYTVPLATPATKRAGPVFPDVPWVLAWTAALAALAAALAVASRRAD